jgi:cyclopropane-fatty-acyl-phospholipid synthase
MMDNTLYIARKSSLYENIVLRRLARMDKGRLELELPDGSCLTIGDGLDAVRARIRICDPVFYQRCILYGDIGFGEAYVDGLWDTDDITAVISWALLNVDRAPGISGNKTQTLVLNILKWWNRRKYFKRANTLKGSRQNISDHYDLSNEFFRLFLDETMTYSSAYFRRDGMTLEEAQLAKYERLCQQLHLSRADHVLEIGSGWGFGAVYMAKRYGCRVTSVTISAEQYHLATERVKAEGLEDLIQIRLKDYRKLSGQFDKIVSVEMLEAVGHQYLDTYFRKCNELLKRDGVLALQVIKIVSVEMLEAVGHKYLDTYFSKCNELLKRDGVLALQVITCPDSRYESMRKGVDWIQKHIFPGSLLPSVSAINAAINRAGEMMVAGKFFPGRSERPGTALCRYIEDMVPPF